ncbi:TPA: three-Cys-motif partner protein TcmP [Stenotrophomonas maltophilia]|nr:three-Cys-motif partner protein TcmP [Stenotrophomonas maltophilia]
MDDQYESDEDGYPREIVGPWVSDKHHFLRHYVTASQGARGKMGGAHCLIDLYCGPGKARIRGGQGSVFGGTLTAVDAAARSRRGQAVPFTRVFISDVREENVSACKARLSAISDIQVTSFVGEAETNVHKVVTNLPRRGIHLAYLDPYSLHQLPFSVLKALAEAPRVDLLIHFAASDMARNLERCDLWPRFDAVAPGWQDSCDTIRGKSVVRQQFFAYWTKLVQDLGYHVSDRVVSVKNTRRREIYRLVLASKHKLGDNIWRTLNDRSGQKGLSL